MRTLQDGHVRNRILRDQRVAEQVVVEVRAVAAKFPAELVDLSLVHVQRGAGVGVAAISEAVQAQIVEERRLARVGGMGVKCFADESAAPTADSPWWPTWIAARVGHHVAAEFDASGTQVETFGGRVLLV